MTVYKVDPKTISIDCSCKNGNAIIIGPYKIPCNSIYYYGTVRLHKGERIKIGKNIYLEYEDNNRIYLDYDMYLKIYSLVKAVGSIKVFGTRYYIRYDDAMANDYEQVITKDYFEFGILFEQPLITKDGLKNMKIDDLCRIRKGECRVCTKDEVPICYGDPE